MTSNKTKKTKTKEKQVPSFSTEPKKILLVGSGFLGKYLLTRQLEGLEQFIEGKTRINPFPLTYILDKQNPDTLYKFPLLENYEGKGYSEYLWQSMGDTMTLQKEKIHEKVDDIVITSAIADVPYAMKSPVDTYQTNVINTLQLMEYLRINDFAGKIILMSSESVLGHQPHDKLPLNEECLPNPANIYGSSKLAQEQIGLTYAKSYGMNVTILRSATMYGPYGRTKQAVPIFIRQILEHKPVTLEGDGSQSRDFVFVEDTARAIELALYVKNPKKIRGEIINIGSGKELRFSDLIKLIAHTVGLRWDFTKADNKDVKVKFKPFRAGEEGLRVCLDITKAKKLLDYEPMYPMTGIGSSGLKTTIEWIANWVLNFDEDEMDELRHEMYPLKYSNVQQKQNNKLTSSQENIQVSV